jgi:hypothetical protein
MCYNDDLIYRRMGHLDLLEKWNVGECDVLGT